MKISFNIKLNNEISSGGMNFSYELISFLKDKGIQIVHSLNDDDIDIIFHINITYCSCYSYYAAFLYKLAHPKTIIIHRVNDSGLQRKNKTMTKRMNKCSYYSDQIIYISDWLQSIMYQRLDESRPFTIIRNGGNSNIFNNVNRLKWDNNSKLKIVTHHYSSNYLKGHEYYQILDKYLNNKSNNDRFEFTYIGNYPKDLNYRNTTIIPVLQGKSLANQLSKHDIYLTGSKYEAGGMHHIEGALCGLPILYLSSGALPEYCKEFGVEFNRDNFINKLEHMFENYDLYYNRMKYYNRTAKKMFENYFNLFESLYLNSNKPNLLWGRKKPKKPKNSVIIKYVIKEKIYKIKNFLSKLI